MAIPSSSDISLQRSAWITSSGHGILLGLVWSPGVYSRSPPGRPFSFVTSIRFTIGIGLCHTTSLLDGLPKGQLLGNSLRWDINRFIPDDRTLETSKKHPYQSGIFPFFKFVFTLTCTTWRGIIAVKIPYLRQPFGMRPRRFLLAVKQRHIFSAQGLARFILKMECSFWTTQSYQKEGKENSRGGLLPYGQKFHAASQWSYCNYCSSPPNPSDERIRLVPQLPFRACGGSPS